MKKFIALAIAILMMAALAVPAFAAEIDEETVNKTAQATVSYTVGETYTVTIPEAITVGAAGASLEVEANRNAEKTVVVTVASANGFKLNSDDDYAYVLKAGETTITAEENTVLTTTAKETKSVVLSASWVNAEKKPTAAGTYSDTLTFTVTAAA